MKCPYCGEEMEKGRIKQNRVPLTWVSDKRIENRFLPLHKTIELSSLSTGCETKTWHCEKCRKFIIDEDDL